MTPPLRASQVAVMVIAKEPVPGRVKTRLTPPCSPEQAALLAAAALRDTLEAVAAAPVGDRVVVLEGTPGDWLPPGFEVRPQAGGTLGERLAVAFDAVDPPAIVVGMDTPQVGVEGIEAAVGALCAPAVDAVLGRALDGGYWTIGFSRTAPGAFDGVPMSVPDTADAQLARLRQLGLTVAEAHPLRDLDRWDDAVAIAEAHPRLHTAVTVRRIGAEVTA